MNSFTCGGPYPEPDDEDAFEKWLRENYPDEFS